MSKDLNYYIEWLENSIYNKNIIYFDYLNFTNVKLIGNGSYGNIFCANWENNDTIFALKTFNNQISILKEVVKEVKEIYSFFL